MAGIFKAYDVRGIYPSSSTRRSATDRPRLPARAGRARTARSATRWWSRRDMRESSAGLAARPGARADRRRARRLDIGLSTTPMNYFAISHFTARRRRAGDGEPQPGAVQRLQVQPPRRAAGLRRPRHRADGAEGRRRGTCRRPPRRGKVTPGEVFGRVPDARPLVPPRGPDGARRLKVVVDAANGMATIDQPILEAMDIELVPLYFELDGTLPQPRGEPAQGGEPARPRSAGARRPAPISGSPSTATPTAPRSSTRPARRSAAT